MTQWQGWEESPVLLTLFGNAFDYRDANASATATFSRLCPLCLSPDRWSRVVCYPLPGWGGKPFLPSLREHKEEQSHLPPAPLSCPALSPLGPPTAAELGAPVPCYRRPGGERRVLSIRAGA